MEEQVLSIEQMRELQELGIDNSKASMCWLLDGDPDEPYPYLAENKGYNPVFCKPTFTVHDILKMLPKYINKDDKTYFLTLLYDAAGCVFMYCTEHIKDVLYSVGSAKETDSAFRTIKWCKQNNYI